MASPSSTGPVGPLSVPSDPGRPAPSRPGPVGPHRGRGRGERRRLDDRAAQRRRNLYFRDSGVDPRLACEWTDEYDRIVCYEPYLKFRTRPYDDAYCLTHREFRRWHPELDLGRFTRGSEKSGRWHWHCDCPDQGVDDWRLLRRAIEEGYWEWIEYGEADPEEEGLWPLSCAGGAGPDLESVRSHYWCW